MIRTAYKNHPFVFSCCKFLRKTLFSLLLLFGFYAASSQSSIAYLRSGLSTDRLHKLPAGTDLRIPFDLVRGMIVMQAQMDQQTGRFILDTGAPLMVVNDEPQEVSRTAASFHQEIQVGETRINSFNWAGTEEKSLEALVLDISHLESAFGRSLQGMIGYNALKRYEVFFDYENQFVLRCDPRKNSLHRNSDPLYSIPFQLYDHLPVIIVQVGNRKLRLGLDTGACANLIDKKVLESLSEELFSVLPDEEVQGLDQSVKQVKAVEFKTVEVKDLAMSDVKFLTTELPELHTEDGTTLDGLVGYAFLSRMKFSINYPKGRIFVWE